MSNKRTAEEAFSKLAFFQDLMKGPKRSRPTPTKSPSPKATNRRPSSGSSDLYFSAESSVQPEATMGISLPFGGLDGANDDDDDDEEDDGDKTPPLRAAVPAIEKSPKKRMRRDITTEKPPSSKPAPIGFDMKHMLLFGSKAESSRHGCSQSGQEPPTKLQNRASRSPVKAPTPQERSPQNEDEGHESDDSSVIDVEEQKDQWGSQTWPIDKILTHRWFPKEGENGTYKYLVKWEGDEWDEHLDSTWEPEENFELSREALKVYWAHDKDVKAGKVRPFNLAGWEKERLRKGAANGQIMATYWGDYEDPDDVVDDEELEKGYYYGYSDSEGEAIEVSGVPGERGYRRTKHRKKVSQSDRAKREAQAKHRIMMERHGGHLEEYIAAHKARNAELSEQARARKRAKAEKEAEEERKRRAKRTVPVASGRPLPSRHIREDGQPRKQREEEAKRRAAREASDRQILIDRQKRKEEEDKRRLQLSQLKIAKRPRMGPKRVDVMAQFKGGNAEPQIQIPNQLTKKPVAEELIENQSPKKTLQPEAPMRPAADDGW